MEKISPQAKHHRPQAKKMSGGDELTGVNLGPVDPATKIVCAQPPFLSLSGLVSNYHRTGIFVRGVCLGNVGPDVSIRPVANKVWFSRIEILVFVVVICISSEA